MKTCCESKQNPDMSEIYQKEFWLNLEKQLGSYNPKEFMTVGYSIDNYVLFTLIIPKKILGF